MPAIDEYEHDSRFLQAAAMEAEPEPLLPFLRNTLANVAPSTAATIKWKRLTSVDELAGELETIKWAYKIHVNNNGDRSIEFEIYPSGLRDFFSRIFAGLFPPKETFDENLGSGH